MDKHIPNEKELIRPRRLCLRRELPEPGTKIFACGANYQGQEPGRNRVGPILGLGLENEDRNRIQNNNK